MKRHILVLLIFFSVASCFAQGTWTQKATFIGAGLDAPFSFSIGGKGYSGTGQNNSGVFTNQFWEYDPATNVWAQKANYSGGARYAAIGFSIGNKGYAGLGLNSANTLQQDFWEYDPATNSWNQKANFGGAARDTPVGFSIGNMGYFATGETNTTFFNDIWQYNPVTDVWTQKTSMPRTGFADANCFVIGTNAYVLGGYAGSVFLDDVWEYNSLSDSWIQKAHLPTGLRCDAAAFAVCDIGYYGTGEGPISGRFNADLWQYNNLTDTWLQKANFIGTVRDEAAFFTIGSKAFIGLGRAITTRNDFYQYTPDSMGSCVGTPVSHFISSDTSFCAEAGECIDFFDHSLNSPTSWEWFFPGAFPDTSTQPNPTGICYSTVGTFTVTLIVSNSAGSDTLIVSPMITVGGTPPTPVISASGNILTSSHALAYQWYYNGSPILNATDSFYVATMPGNYAVMITDVFGCTRLSDGVWATVNELNGSGGIAIYPNPAGEWFEVSGLKFEVNPTIRIYNILGSLELQTSDFKPPTRIDVSTLAKGVYIVEVSNGERVYRAKFVKE